jgi:transcriptional regulator with XRE-family HTH domain
MTQEEVALEAEINLRYMGAIERGQRNPSILVLARIAAALKVEPSDLLKRRR